jgi:hypothetical protein
LFFGRDPAFAMELFLNLCWLSLLMPGYLLWRKRTPSDHLAPFVFLCTLGCALILLFPVISATDDLHAIRPEMEESERAFRQAGHRVCTFYTLTHSAQPILLGSSALAAAFEQIGTVLPFSPRALRILSASGNDGRAPPSENPVSL